PLCWRLCLSLPVCRMPPSRWRPLVAPLCTSGCHSRLRAALTGGGTGRGTSMATDGVLEGMTMSDDLWLVIALIAVGTFAIRAVPLLWMRRHLQRRHLARGPQRMPANE